jgi:hypothetical protein
VHALDAERHRACVGVCDFEAVLRAAVPNPAPTAGRGPSSGAAGVLTCNAPTNRGVWSFCDDNPTLPCDGAHGADGVGGEDGVGGTGCGSGPVLDVAGASRADKLVRPVRVVASADEPSPRSAGERAGEGRRYLLRPPRVAVGHRRSSRVSVRGRRRASAPRRCERGTSR